VAIWASAGDNAIGWGILACSVLVAVGHVIKSHDSWAQIHQNFTFPDPARLSQAFTKHDQ
jgi:hypothetical protein